MEAVRKTKEYKRFSRRLKRGGRRRDRFSRICAWAERLSRESFKNTRRYLRFWGLLGIAYLTGYFMTRDYYHGWYGVLCSFFDVSVFPQMRWDWSLIWQMGKLLLQLSILPEDDARNVSVVREMRKRGENKKAVQTV